MGNRTTLGAVALLCLIAGEVRGEDPSPQQILKGAVRRARRSYAIGPTVGVGGSWAIGVEEGAFDAPISFGLGFRKFKIPILPDADMVKELIQSRVKAKAKERVKAYLAEGKPPPSDEELREIGLQILAEVKAEILGELDVRSKLIEKPSLALDLEGTYFPKSEFTEIRATIGVGVSRFTIGPTAALVLADETGVFLGGELALRLTPGGGPRPPVIDVFYRVDFAVGGVDSDVMTLGTRFMLDII